MERRKLLQKQPYEQWDLDINFGGPLKELPPGASYIVSNSLSAVKWPRKQPNNKTPATLEILLSDEGVILEPSKLKVRIHVKGGLDSYDYQITTKVVFDNGAKLEDELYIRVKEK